MQRSTTKLEQTREGISEWTLLCEKWFTWNLTWVIPNSTHVVKIRPRIFTSIWTRSATDTKFCFQFVHFSPSPHLSQMWGSPDSASPGSCPETIVMKTINFLSLPLLCSRRPIVVVPGPCAPVAWVGHQGVRPVRDRHGHVSEHGRQRPLQDGQGRLPPAHHHVQRRSAPLSSQLPQGK